MNNANALIVTETIYDHAAFLNENISNEEKYELAQNIIINYVLPLDVNQILIAFEKINSWSKANASWCLTMHCRLYLFNKVLNINKNMYVALILALCGSFDVACLIDFVVVEKHMPIDIGINKTWYMYAITGYKTLLDYYEFDVSNIQTIPDIDKQIIQDYHNEKYAGKLTKRATKK